MSRKFEGPCGFSGCAKRPWARGYCQSHYAQARRGVPFAPIKTRVAKTPVERPSSRTEPRPDWPHTQESCRLCNEVVWAKGLCDRHYQLDTKWRPFGLTADGYEEKLKAQNYRCEICSAPSGQLVPGVSIKTRLSVDHCHRTNKVRALLCDRCNRGIGLLQDDPGILLRAAAYIERYEAETSP